MYSEAEGRDAPVFDRDILTADLDAPTEGRRNAGDRMAVEIERDPVARHYESVCATPEVRGERRVLRNDRATPNGRRRSTERCTSDGERRNGGHE